MINGHSKLIALKFLRRQFIPFKQSRHQFSSVEYQFIRQRDVELTDHDEEKQRPCVTTNCLGFVNSNGFCPMDFRFNGYESYGSLQYWSRIKSGIDLPSTELTLSNPRFGDGTHYIKKEIYDHKIKDCPKDDETETDPSEGSTEEEPCVPVFEQRERVKLDFKTSAAINNKYNDLAASSDPETKKPDGPRFFVDINFHSTKIVDHVIIYPRKDDCCRDRYQQMTVKIGERECERVADFTEKYVKTTDRLKWECEMATGDRIEVANPQSTQIQIVEIKAYGYSN